MYECVLGSDKISKYIMYIAIIGFIVVSVFPIHSLLFFISPYLAQILEYGFKLQTTTGVVSYPKIDLPYAH